MAAIDALFNMLLDADGSDIRQHEQNVMVIAKKHCRHQGASL